MRVETPAAAAALPEYRRALVELLSQLADDELAIGHRDSEWLGLGPHIEEDVAFSSIAQDEVGHAALFYRFLGELGEGRPDEIAFARPATAWRNAVLLERPNGAGHYMADPQYDWAFTIARHFLYDLFDSLRLEALTGSSYVPLAQAAVKIRREERYHLLHQSAWFRRLGNGTAESHRRLTAAVERVWPEVGGLFAPGPAGADIARLGVLPAGPVALQARWTDQAVAAFAAAGLAWPGDPPAPPLDGRSGQHAPDLDELTATMSEVYRQDPVAQW